MAKKSKKSKAAGKKAGGSKAKSHGQSWSKDDLKQLKTLIKQNTPTRLIAMKLRRTKVSVRGKVYKEGLSLRPTNRSPRD